MAELGLRMSMTAKMAPSGMAGRAAWPDWTLPRLRHDSAGKLTSSATATTVIYFDAPRAPGGRGIARTVVQLDNSLHGQS